MTLLGSMQVCNHYDRGSRERVRKKFPDELASKWKGAPAPYSLSRKAGCSSDVHHVVGPGAQPHPIVRRDSALTSVPSVVAIRPSISCIRGSHGVSPRWVELLRARFCREM